jgi:hypothetical protein
MALRTRIHRIKKNKEKDNTYTNERNDELNPLITENQYIIQAKIDRHGILQRQDKFTGENKNEIIDFKPVKEKKKKNNENKNKYLPGERLLYTIRNDNPEYLDNNYKPITTKKKEKLKTILDKLTC